MLREQFLIHELAERAGVSVRTVRYYLDEGLLPPPDSQGRYAYFNEEHLHRLELIKRLKEAFLPLKEIRSQVNALTDAEVMALLRDKGWFTQGPTRVFAQNRILSPPAKPDETSSNALEYISRLLDAHTAYQTNPEPEAGVQSNLRYQDTSPMHEKRSSDMDYLKSRMPEVLAGKIMRRVDLAPGVELTYQEPDNPQDAERIRRIINFAQNLFKQK